MPFSTEFLPDQSTLIVTLASDFDPKAEAPAVTQTLATTIGAFEAPLHLIIDFRAAAGKSTMDRVMHGAAMLSQFAAQTKVCDILMVTDTELMKLVAAGLATPIFGKLKIKIFPTIEEAQEYIRAQSA